MGTLRLVVALLSIGLLCSCRFEELVGEGYEPGELWSDSDLEMLCTSQYVAVQSLENDVSCATPEQFSFEEESKSVAFSLDKMWDGTIARLSEVRYREDAYDGSFGREWTLDCSLLAAYPDGSRHVYRCALPASYSAAHNTNLILSGLELTNPGCKARIRYQAEFGKGYDASLCRQPGREVPVSVYWYTRRFPELLYRVTGP